VLVAVNRALAVAFLAIGVGILVETVAAGGGVGFKAGYLAGVVFVLLGVLRWRAVRPPGARRP
jgi:hypothetical protein